MSKTSFSIILKMLLIKLDRTTTIYIGIERQLKGNLHTAASVSSSQDAVNILIVFIIHFFMHLFYLSINRYFNASVSFFSSSFLCSMPTLSVTVLDPD